MLRQYEPLVAAGADPYDLGVQFDGHGELAAHACEADCPHLLRVLLGRKYRVDVNFVERQGFTLLSIAAKYNACQCIPVLLTRGASINLFARPVDDKERGKYTPLFYAAEKGHLPACRLLLDAGAAVDTPSGPQNLTALHAAANRGAVGVIGLLLNRGADPHATGTELQTPIMEACFYREVLAVQALLPRAELAHVNSDGFTLLHLAASFGGPAVLEAVLPRYVAAGLVDVPSTQGRDLVTAVGSTPLMLACNGVGEHATGSKYEEVKLLLRAGASRNAVDSWNNNVVLICASGTDAASMRKLLGKAPPWKYTPEQLNQTSAKGRKPLEVAVRAGSVDVCKLLMAAGATMEPSYGKLALDFWPDRPALAALFGAEQAPLAPPCCERCQKSDGKLKACKCCTYCGKACQAADWKQHKRTCVAPADAFKEAHMRMLEKERRS